MLFSEKEERGRRFTLALRAGIPVLILIFLVFYTTIYKGENVRIGLVDGTTFGRNYLYYHLFYLFFHEPECPRDTDRPNNTGSLIKKHLSKN